jgi:flagellar hook assembly protein FlgD
VEASEEKQVPVSTNAVKTEPNPFRTATTISYSLTVRTRVDCKVFDASGRIVTTLFSGIQDKGAQRLVWNRADDQGLRVNHGVYFVRITAEGLLVQSKLVVL